MIGLNKRAQRQSGTAIVEFVITLPFLILLLASIVDLTRATQSYSRLTRIAYEATRFASGQPGLEEGAFSTIDFHSQHTQSLVLSRINKLLQDNQFNLADTAIVSEYRRGGGSYELTIGSESIDAVRIRITSEYRGILPIYNHILLNVTAGGPYLYPDKG